MPGRLRDNIKIGAYVGIILKKDQKNGTITKGVVMKLLTKVAKHHRGIKVMLEDKQVGRVQEIY